MHVGVRGVPVARGKWGAFRIDTQSQGVNRLRGETPASHVQSRSSLLSGYSDRRLAVIVLIDIGRKIFRIGNDLGDQAGIGPDRILD